MAEGKSFRLSQLLDFIQTEEKIFKTEKKKNKKIKKKN
jgi:hypothetical protein